MVVCMRLSTVELVLSWSTVLCLVASYILVLWLPSWHKILDNFLMAQLKEMAM